MNSLENKLKLQQANKLYKDKVNNLTQLELILKCYSRSIEFIEVAIESLKNNDTKTFRKNTMNATIILQNMLFNLNYTDSNGNKLIVAENLNSMYIFILETLNHGFRNNSSLNFDVCIEQLQNLHDAFRQANGGK